MKRDRDTADELVKLGELKPGEAGSVVAIDTLSPHRRRLMEMGIIEGTRIEMIQSAPWGGPVHIRLRGYELCLRREDALLVVISK